jgi:hypothetical protein
MSGHTGRKGTTQLEGGGGGHCVLGLQSNAREITGQTLLAICKKAAYVLILHILKFSLIVFWLHRENSFKYFAAQAVAVRIKNLKFC